MNVDLSELKAGDSVKFRNGETGFIGLIQESRYYGIGDVFRIDFFTENYIGIVTYFHDNYFKNGKLMVLNTSKDCDIVEIIPNPRCWTDDDMRAAFERDGWQLFDNWLEEYRAGKK
jgi:hypothetical protein